METKLKNIVLAGFIAVVFGCEPIDYQTLTIDYKNKEFEIISSNNYVIDSICIEKFGRLYYSLSLQDKNSGESSISLDRLNSNYRVFVDSLEVIPCEEKNYNMEIFIRKKGSSTKLTKDIANNFKHVDDIQTFRGLSYKHCLKRVDTLPAERRYR